MELTSYLHQVGGSFMELTSNQYSARDFSMVQTSMIYDALYMIY